MCDTIQKHNRLAYYLILWYADNLTSQLMENKDIEVRESSNSCCFLQKFPVG